MSNLGLQQQNTSYDGILQIPGGVTAQLQQVQDGEGRSTGLWLSSAGTNAATADSFTVSIDGTVVPNVVPRLISDGLGDCVSVKDFGAIGDGVTNDTAAIIKAFGYLSSGKSLFFPAGTYIYNNNQTTGSPVVLNGLSNVAIFGAGSTIQLGTNTSFVSLKNCTNFV